MRVTARGTANLFLFLAIPVGAPAQGPVTAPQVGAMIDSTGALRTVSGIAGSFLVGPVRAPRVLALACAGTFCIAKTDAGMITPHGILNAPPGDAVLATDGRRSIVWFAQTRAFFQLQMGGRVPELQWLDWRVDGEVLSMRLTQGGTDIAVRRDSGVWIVSSAGAVRDSLPGEASGAVALLDDQVLYTAGRDVVVRHADGTEARFAIPSVPLNLFRIGADWVEIIANDANYAVRTSSVSNAVYMLPGGVDQPRRVRP